MRVIRVIREKPPENSQTDQYSNTALTAYISQAHHPPMPTQDLPQQWRDHATDYLRIAKTYGRCVSTADQRAGYVKAAAQLNDCADQLERSLAEQSAKTPASEAQGMDQESVCEAAHGDGKNARGEEREDQAQGLLDVPSVRTGDVDA